MIPQISARARGPLVVMAHEAGRSPRRSPNRVACLDELYESQKSIVFMRRSSRL
jgi:hypothetical protein